MRERARGCVRPPLDQPGRSGSARRRVSAPADPRLWILAPFVCFEVQTAAWRIRPGCKVERIDASFGGGERNENAAGMDICGVAAGACSPFGGSGAER